MPYFVSYGESAKGSIENSFVPELEHEFRTHLVSNKKISSDEKEKIPNTLALNVSSRTKSIPDVIGRMTGNWCVSEPIKNEIDNLEKDVHEFYKVQIKFNDGKIFSEDYYLMRILQTVDAIDYENTAFSSRKYGREAARESGFNLDVRWGRPCVLQENKIQGVHLWRWGGEGAFNYFCSDELRNFFVENKYLGWTFYGCQTN